MEESLIRQLDNWLALNQPDFYARLQPGASDAQLNTFEIRFSIVLPISFRQLYSWRNGQDSSCRRSFQGNRMFSSLDEISAAKDLLDCMIGYDIEDPRYWRRGWVPFLKNGSGIHLCLDIFAVDGGKPGRLVAFWKADQDRPVEYPSLDAWLEHLVHSMEAGMWKSI